MTSVIVPVLDDTDAVARLIARLTSSPDVEIVIVDGGRDARLDRLAASRADVSVVRTPAGRGRQMNAGVAAASGRWLLFLHADSQPPAGWRDAIAAADRDPAIVGGWFRFALDAPAWQARVIERLVAARVAMFRLPYGDQGVFVRRDTFEALGGYREWPLMEDVEFVRRLTRRGRVLSWRGALITSARRWQRDGWFRRSTKNLVLLTLYFLGVSPARLARWY